MYTYLWGIQMHAIAQKIFSFIRACSFDHTGSRNGCFRAKWTSTNVTGDEQRYRVLQCVALCVAVRGSMCCAPYVEWTSTNVTGIWQRESERQCARRGGGVGEIETEREREIHTQQNQNVHESARTVTVVGTATHTCCSVLQCLAMCCSGCKNESARTRERNTHTHTATLTIFPSLCLCVYDRMCHGVCPQRGERLLAHWHCWVFS